MNILNKIFSDPNEREMKRMSPIIERINAFEREFEKLSDEQLKKKTDEFKAKLEKGETLDDILPDAFAAVREAAKRTLKLRHYDVQLLAGIVLHRGNITEMKTGEGKTLMATLPIYLNALTGDGVHVVTVNDYLAQRDANWMGPVYYTLGLSVACIQQQGRSYVYDPKHKNTKTQKHVNKSDSDDTKKDNVNIDMKELREISRKEAYDADITYGTNNEFGFDYLRDNMALSMEAQVQRGLSYAIVDEVDSILIDEARTPLIISAPAEQAADQYYQFARIIPTLKEGEDYNIDEKMRAATLTEEGIQKVEKALGVENLYAEGGIKLVHHLEQALKAYVLFKRDKDYVVKDDQVMIVDEFTGRIMHGRRFSDGLHQALEAKENVTIQQESVTMATITFQNYFRLHKKLSGMTGTAKTEEEEFAKIYGLSVLEIPTNKPIIRNDKGDLVYKNEKGKFAAIIKEIKRRNELGQPVLVGTASIEKNEYLGALLKKEEIAHEILNAKNHEREAEIIAQAGRVGAVTIATNMAGRGVDIVLGGTPTDMHARDTVKRLGGLHVIGTERHESRRIDNQLRGRSGRQGDPGSTQFFISTEDDLMRIFGSDRMKTVMERLGVPDDMPIENKIISRSIEAAQKKVEGHNFDIRKHVVQYDDVINKHREVIYRMRQEVLSSKKDRQENTDSLDQNSLKTVDPQEFDSPVVTDASSSQNSNKILKMIAEEIEIVVKFHTQSEKEMDWNLDEIYEVVDTIFPIPLEVRLKLQDIYDQVQKGDEHLKGREALIHYLIQCSSSAYSDLDKNITAAGSDTERTFSFKDIERAILLRSIDTLWIEHIDAMDHLRQGIGLRGYGQRDPLVEYKKEAYRMFEALQVNIRKQVVYSIFKVGHVTGFPQASQEQKLQFKGAEKTLEKGHGQFGTISGTMPQAAQAQNSTVFRMMQKQAGVKEAPVTTERKVGRNDPCPCGATKKDGTPVKYKKCHGV